MANEIFKEIKTRIALRWLEYATWSAEAFKAEKPLKGEVWFCEVPTGNANAQTAPTVLFKVGDGVNTFGDLKWGSALAADVYAWAKKATPDWTDFPALPIEVIDNETGKFVTDFEYANNTLTIHRANVALDDISDKEKIALASDLEDLGRDLAQLTNLVHDNKTQLTTTAGHVVGAINEHDAEIGDLDDLNTTNKGNLVSAINEALQAVEVGGTGSVVTVTKAATPTTGSEATYVVNQGGKAVDVKIEIPKYATDADYGVLEVKGDNTSGVVVDNTDAQRPIVKIAANTYDAHGAAAAVLGESTDGASANTVYGAKAAAAAAQNDATIAKTKIETFLGTVTPDGSQSIIDTLAEINSYIGEHGEEFATLSGKVTNIENGTTTVPKAADADTLDGKDSTYFATAESVQNISDNLGDLAAKDKIVEGDIDGTIAVGKISGLGALATKDNITHDLVTDFDAEVAKIKVTNAGNADTLGNHGADHFATAESVTEITKDNGTIDSKISAYDAGKGFGDIITHNVAEFATTAQGGKADTALQEVEVGTGLKVSEKAENKQTIEIDTDVVFVLDCNW